VLHVVFSQARCTFLQEVLQVEALRVLQNCKLKVRHRFLEVGKLSSKAVLCHFYLFALSSLPVFCQEIHSSLKQSKT